MLNEFREFAVKGNVVDLAIGVIIGAAFGQIVTSVVSDLFMPLVGAVFGGLDFSNYFIPLSANVTENSLAAAREQGAVFAYGHFLTVVINFLIVAWILFIVVKGINRLRRKAATEPPPAPPAPTREESLLMEIRDILAQKA
ncbi:large conductance mechanosensitive channel protein MscL [Ancylobacter mangrovi]|uniref:Large-conductance mechanosensitive channel n=1 Tax=Ancylobacter mangrovi TaxID=2972472 RepID=A0A9X2PB55_9HYPH|nr:large conductance mechanosensitive channel protein MscL [Ancylobacter mangrovi]MCS0495479.1 large conductance mechanosensitive channel protein MscL [Ancylobacter mangrovi]MCS0503127.1 large conductance mechanosensitive channel protein MscL [Ancylobacter mangrovi]